MFALLPWQQTFGPQYHIWSSVIDTLLHCLKRTHKHCMQRTQDTIKKPSHLLHRSPNIFRLFLQQFHFVFKIGRDTVSCFSERINKNTACMSTIILWRISPSQELPTFKFHAVLPASFSSHIIVSIHFTICSIKCRSNTRI